MSENSGIIYLVPTPIGNMSDVSDRMREVLESVDMVACEDTRHSGSFLKKLEIKKRLISYHEFNESERAVQLVEAVKNGESVAVITDGGTPGISDPAYRIVKVAIENDLIIIPIPGPTAFVPALTASGLPTDRFLFEGFLSNKSAARTKRLTQLVDFPHTIILYESPHRIEKTVAAILDVFGDRQICIAREISKKFEQFIRGSVSEVTAVLNQKKLKGEIVIIIEGNRSK